MRITNQVDKKVKDEMDAGIRGGLQELLDSGVHGFGLPEENAQPYLSLEVLVTRTIVP